MELMRLAGGDRRRFVLLCATLALSGGLGAPVTAQLVTVGRVQYQQHPTVPLKCELGGAWLGPYDFEQVMNPVLNLRNPTYDDRDWGELTHALLLPPPSDAPTEESNRVLIVARRYDTGSLANPGGDTPQVVFFWDRAHPGDLTTQVVNPEITNGSAELFCGGHALTTGGNVLFVGGTDEVKQMQYEGAFWGHRYTHLFMNTTTPTWVYQNWAEPPEVPPVPMMQRDRWYPTALRLADGSILVAGHGNNPVAVPNSGETRERCDVDDAAGTVTWRIYGGSSLLKNVVGSTCHSSSLADLEIYPRMHPLISGEIFASLAYTNVLTLNTCADPANPDRWTTIQSILRPAPDATSVHYVDLTPETGPTEIIYSLGGVLEDTHTLATNRVLRMDVNVADPGASTWTNVGVPQMNSPRIYLNTVILLDGSMVVVGGVSQDPDSFVETYFYHPERYAPPGIFASPDTAWSYMNAEADERTYHTVALLLPSGEVFTAGGQGTSVFVDGQGESLSPVPPWYTVELYQPFYMCNPGRPQIKTMPASIAFGARDVPLDVRLHSTSSAGETRVALVGPGNSTHAMDAGQVYIKLKFAPFTPNANPNQATTIHFDAPPDGNVAPPGWYLLTVVNAEGLPSEGRWIRVGVP